MARCGQNPIVRLPNKGIGNRKHEGGRSGLRREQQRSAVADRQAARSRRSAYEQLVALDHRLGLDEGARKERARLTASLSDKVRSTRLELLNRKANAR